MEKDSQQTFWTQSSPYIRPALATIDDQSLFFLIQATKIFASDDAGYA